MSKTHMLTTIDNPYNPFTQFRDWYAFDTREGYNSSALLARVVNHSDELSESDQELERENAILEIVKENLSGVHVRVTKDSDRFSKVSSN